MSSLFQAPPDGWQRTTLRHLVQGPKNGAWGSEAGEDEIDAVCVRVADFDWSRLTLKLEDPTTRSFRKQQFKNLQLRRGDIVIEKSGGGEKTPVGRVVSFDEDVDAVTSNFVARIRPRASVLNRFFLYLLAAHYMSGYSHQFIKQNTGIQNLDDANLFRSDVWIPDLATQRQIADFLDRETARIDLLIEKKQKLVALLGDRYERKREQVLSVNDEHLPLQSLRWLIRVGSGDFISNDQMGPEWSQDYPIPVIGGNGVMAYTNLSNTPNNTLVVGRVGALCGNVHFFEHRSWVTDNALIVRITSNEILPRYTFEVLKSAKLNEKANKSAQPLITGETVKRVQVRLPAKEDQERRVRQLAALSKQLADTTKTVLLLISAEK